MKEGFCWSFKDEISAKPFFPNIKSHPLTNEVVFLISGPSSKYYENSGGVTYYYFTAFNSAINW